MKPWYKKKKVWAAILGALGPVLTIFLAPDNVETVKVIAAAIMQAGVAAGFIFAESSVDKAAAQINTEATAHGIMHALDKGRELYDKGLAAETGFKGRALAELQDAIDKKNIDRAGT